MYTLIIDPLAELPEWVLLLGRDFLRALVENGLLVWVEDDITAVNESEILDALTIPLSMFWPEFDSAKVNGGLETLLILMAQYFDKLNQKAPADPNVAFEIIEWRGLCPLLSLTEKSNT